MHTYCFMCHFQSFVLLHIFMTYTIYSYQCFIITAMLFLQAMFWPYSFTVCLCSMLHTVATVFVKNLEKSFAYTSFFCKKSIFYTFY